MTERILVANLTDDCCPPSEASLPVERAQQIAVVASARGVRVDLVEHHHATADAAEAGAAMATCFPASLAGVERQLDPGKIERRSLGTSPGDSATTAEAIPQTTAAGAALRRFRPPSSARSGRTPPSRA